MLFYVKKKKTLVGLFVYIVLIIEFKRVKFIFRLYNLTRATQRTNMFI